MPEVNQRIALVTGSSRGIGRAIARDLARNGWRVILHGGTDSPALDAAWSELRQIAPDTVKEVADLADPRAIADLFSRHDRIDALVNNAATQNPAAFVDLKTADLDHVLAVNLKAPFLCGQHAARAMRRHGQGGKIVNISSVHALDPKRNFAHYSASKGGLEVLTRSMALELAGDNIQVNSIVAGAIITEMTPAARQSALISAVPAGRIGEPEEIARLVTFLCSRQCDYMTGASLVVDGGLTLGFCASRPDL
jgi:glucose 1-dehydrogenase